jgi:cytochrome oxidase Cu insertion factor (SCO1/SenC/PrrC family)
MVRVLCAFLAAAFALPGCAKTAAVMRPCEQPPDEGGLRVGTEAPEITGEDIDGVPFKLSDYRGQVVLLDFWGNW